jgi:hypothetical protein
MEFGSEGPACPTRECRAKRCAETAASRGSDEQQAHSWRPPWLGGVVLLLVLVLPQAGHAQTTPCADRANCIETFSVHDTSLIRANPDNSFGGLVAGQGDAPFAGTNPDYRGLIQFDLGPAAIPPASTIDSVTLQLCVRRQPAAMGTTPPASALFTIRRATQAWGEASSLSTPGPENGLGVPAATGEATWNSRMHPTAWTTAGGSAVSSPASTQPFASQGTCESFPSTPALRDDARLWLGTPAQNFGWLLRGEETVNQSARQFHSRIAGQFGPLLRIEYTPPPPLPTGVSFLSNRVVNGDAETDPGRVSMTENIAITDWSDGQGGAESSAMTVTLYGEANFPTAFSPGSPHRGQNFFAGGVAPASFMSQTIALPEPIGSGPRGPFTYTLSAWLGGLTTQADEMLLTARFVDAEGQELGRGSIGPVLPGSRGNVTGLVSRTVTGNTPLGTAAVELELSGRLQAGSFIDGYADDLFLSLVEEISIESTQTAAPASAEPTSVAISARELVVGSSSAQEAILFERDPAATNGFTQVATLVAQTPVGGDMFGLSVALDRDVIAVGAPARDVGDPGSVVVFERNAGGPGAWGAVATLRSPPTPGNQLFGWSVAVDGDLVIVGAPPPGPTSSGVPIPSAQVSVGPLVPIETTGSVYVFQRQPGGPDPFALAAELRVSEDQSLPGLEFGFALDLDERVLVVSDPSGNDFVTRVFDRTPSDPAEWTGIGRTTVFGRARPGHDVAVDGDVLVVASDDEAIVYDISGGGPLFPERTRIPTPLIVESVEAFGDTVALGVLIPEEGWLVNIHERDVGGLNNFGQTGQLFPAQFEPERFGHDLAAYANLLAVGGRPMDATGGVEVARLFVPEPGPPGALAAIAALTVLAASRRVAGRTQDGPVGRFA